MRRSVIAAQRVLAIAVAIIVWAVAIGAPVGTRTVLIGRIRREGAGAGIGRALVDIIILVVDWGAVILQRRIRQPIIAPAAAAGVAAGIGIGRDVGLRARADISRSAWRARTSEQSASARQCGCSAHGYDGDGRYQS